ncbi:hypothetical protein [Acidovorax sp. sic0104]|uniref:hypothetical protein n=1 Tax=Acidovorax sp. sic0104 TaxID=2854784 RepID=UPI001C44F1D4|nr:hypothetical protein [Acidovorax sp. sic0104]MBV7543727.1 hypothetical protein [Acidovorax sp. sic0104]
MDLPGITPSSCASVGSAAHKENRRAHGLQSCVVQLRFAGVFLPAPLLRTRPVLAGLLVSTSYDRVWRSDLCDQAGDRYLLLGLASPRIAKKRNAQTFVLSGLQWDEGYLQRWPQSWLCAPSAEVAQLVLNDLSSWLMKRYREGGGQLHVS